jgi:hypothetical protein
MSILSDILSFINIEVTIGSTSITLSGTTTPTTPTTPQEPGSTTADPDNPIPAKEDTKNASDEMPKPTERVTPQITNFNPSILGSFVSGLFLTPYESSITFRNTFNTMISPQDLSSMASSGLSSLMTQFVNNTGLSSFFTVGTASFTGTTMTYPQSESKIDSSNLVVNFNPLNIYLPYLEMQAESSSDQNAEDISNFYTEINIARKKIFDLNTSLYATIGEVLDILNLHRLTKYTKDIDSVFKSPRFFDEFFTDHEQVRNIINLLNDFTAGSKEYMKFIYNADTYNGKIDKLNEIAVGFGDLLEVGELKYVYEDLKFLRVRENLPVYKKIREE